MTTKLILGAPTAKNIYKNLQHRLNILKRQGLTPRLTVVMVGDDPASLSYVAAKKNQADVLGIDFHLQRFPENIDQKSVCKEITLLGSDRKTSGIIIQLPLPHNLARQKVLDSVPADKDVDGLTTSNQISISNGEKKAFIPPTPAAIFRLLDEYDISLMNKKILIVGFGDLVGKPLQKILAQKDISVDVINSATKDTKTLYKSADIVITAVGKPRLIKGEMLKLGVVVIDAGAAMERSGSKINMAGDADFSSVSKVASAISPVPGGVGPVTVAMLYENLVRSCEQLFGKGPLTKNIKTLK